MLFHSVFIFLSIPCLPPSNARGFLPMGLGTLTSRGLAKRIYNGSLVKFEEYPYFVRVYTNDRIACSSSMIEHRWVLTAAHCAIRGVRQVYFGPGVEAGFITKKTDASFVYFVQSQSEYDSFEYDFALIKLNDHGEKIA